MCDEINDRMCRRPSEEDRMCYVPGKEPRRVDPLTFFQPSQFASLPKSERIVPPLDAVSAEIAQYEQLFSQVLEDSGMSREEFDLLVGYIRDQQAVGYTPSGTDLEAFVLSHRPQKPRFPGTVDVRQYSLWGLRPLAPLTHPVVVAVVSIAVDFVPILGQIKMVYESVSGRDVITGDALPMWMRILGPLGATIGKAGKAAKAIHAVGKVAHGAARIAIGRIGPIAIVVALANKPPAVALRMIDKIASMDTIAVKAARAEAEAVQGAVLPITKSQSKVLKQVSEILSPDEIASIERAAAAKAAKPAVVKPPQAPDMPPALPQQNQRARGGSRKPKKSPAKPKYKTKASIVLTKLGAMKEAAGQIHAIENLEGQTVAVIEAVVGGKRVFAAASNSGKHFSAAQKAAIKKMGLHEIGAFGSEIVHAEVNVLEWATKLRKGGKRVSIRRWGVSSGRAGHFICDACRSVIGSLGGVIEEFSALSKTY